MQSDPKPYLLGITGILGGGKSTVAKILESLGAKRISSDELAKRYTAPDTPVLKELIDIFGASILTDDGAPDRKKIAAQVFTDPGKLKALNELIHPRVRNDFKKVLDQMNPGDIIAWEVPLLFETDAYKLCQGTLTVSCPKEIAQRRAEERDGMSSSEFYNRIANQLPIEEKEKRSDWILVNDSDLAELETKCMQIWQKIKKDAG